MKKILSIALILPFALGVNVPLMAISGGVERDPIKIPGKPVPCPSGLQFDSCCDELNNPQDVCKIIYKKRESLLNESCLVYYPHDKMGSTDAVLDESGAIENNDGHLLAYHKFTYNKPLKYYIDIETMLKEFLGE